MRFEDLCLLCEDLLLVKGGSGTAMSPNDYETGINRFIQTKSAFGIQKFEFYLGKPNSIYNCYLQLNYFIEAGYTQSGEYIPAKSFRYIVPQPTLGKFNTKRNEIGNRSQPAYFIFGQNIFVNRGQPIPKVFPEAALRREIASLLEVNNFFKNSYGNGFAFIGDVYTRAPESTFSKIATNWELNKRDIKELPSNLKNLFKKSFGL